MLTAFGRSLVYKAKSMGPSTEPCGIPCATLVLSMAHYFSLYCNSVYFPLQATEILNSILEGYPKPKKQLFVSSI